MYVVIAFLLIHHPAEDGVFSKHPAYDQFEIMKKNGEFALFQSIDECNDYAGKFHKNAKVVICLPGIEQEQK